MKKYTTVKEQIEYGIETIESDRRIEVSLQDFLIVFQTIGELIRFFHQPLHYEKLDDVINFLGQKDEGAFSALSKCYFEILEKYLPKDINDAFDAGERFDNPNPPYYFKEKD